MTGFGSGEAEGDNARVRVSVRSVNSRFLDVQIRTPSSLQSAEADLRQLIQKRVKRGKLTAHFELEDRREGAAVPTLDEGVVQGYVAGLERLRELAAGQGEVDWNGIGRMPGVFRFEEAEVSPEELAELAKAGLSEALDDFAAMRAREGEALEVDLRGRLGLIEGHLDRLDILAGEARENLESRLRQKVEKLLRPGEVNEDRLTLEIVLLAEKADITEELVRFRSHNSQFLGALDQGDEVGRRLNFLLQEMNREANTISSKAGEAEMVHLAVELKEEVERIREQIQNIA